MLKVNIKNSESTGHLLALTLVCVSTIALVVSLFWSTATSIVDIWSASETFTHGYFVLPVFFWLVWRQSDTLAQVQLRPDLLAIVPLFCSGVLWLLSKLAGIQVGEHAAFVLILISALWAVMGRDMAGALKFPLAFLFFIAPVGEEFVPHLMEITADMTVWAIRQTSIPIYREGLFFSLPSGNWSVVEACSGIRYLISSAVLGALYAYLNFNSMALRVGFFAFAIVVPILANGMRAFMIVMLGHFSGNRIATGVDHLVYGWLFFGFVMFVLFSIGSKLKKYDTQNAAEALNRAGNKLNSDPEALHHESSLSEHHLIIYRDKLPSLLTVAAIITLWPIWFSATSLGNTPITTDTLAARVLKDGLIVDDAKEPLDASVSLWQPRNFGHDVRVEATYQDIEAKNVHSTSVRAIAFAYQEQRQGKEMVSTRNTLVNNSADSWRVIHSTNKTVEPVNHSYTNREITRYSAMPIIESILKSSTQQIVVWQWYRIGDTRTTNQLIAKLIEVQNKLLLRDTVSVAYILATDATNNDYESALSKAMALIDSEASL